MTQRGLHHWARSAFAAFSRNVSASGHSFRLLGNFCEAVLGQGIQKLEKYAAKGVVRNAHLLLQISGGSSRIIFRWGRVNLLFQLLFPIYLIVFAG
jgi:hypothetical protein